MVWFIHFKSLTAVSHSRNLTNFEVLYHTPPVSRLISPDPYFYNLPLFALCFFTLYYHPVWAGKAIFKAYPLSEALHGLFGVALVQEKLHSKY